MEANYERSSKRVKAVLCLTPAEVLRTARTECENLKAPLREILWETMLQNQEMREGNSRPKNRIVEEVLDQKLGFLMQTVSAEVTASVRNFFAQKLYESVERSNSKSKLRDPRRIAHENTKNEIIDSFLEQRYRERYPQAQKVLI